MSPPDPTSAGSAPLLKRTKPLARATFHRLPESWQAEAWQWRGRISVARMPNFRVTRRFVRRYGLRVRRGPFAGLVYPRTIFGVNPFLTPKLVGAFEAEIQPWIERLVAEPFALVANIGSADGYYAVGFAMRMPEVRVIAWEVDLVHRRLTRLAAERNGVADRVEMRGLCEPQDLAALSPDVRTLVFADVEGAEDELLDPAGAPALARSTILVEVHEMYAPGVGARLRERFATTHVIEDVADRPRYRDDYPELSTLGVGFFEQDLAVNESRTGHTTWLLLRPREPAVARSDA